MRMSGQQDKVRLRIHTDLLLFTVEWETCSRALFSDVDGKKQQQKKSQTMLHGFTMVAVNGDIFMK